MTKLQPGKLLVRETATLERGDPLVIAASPRYLRMWPKGTRRKVSVPWDAIYDLARRLEARRLQGEKLLEKWAASRSK
jgi:hypothetical protein